MDEMMFLPLRALEQVATFAVLGVPAPQGSKTRMPNGAMVEAASATGRAKVRAWRSDVAHAAADHVAFLGLSEPFSGALAIDIAFRFSRPKSRARRASPWHTRKPDKDKLIRATFDGLKNGGLVADDALFAAGGWIAYETTGWTGAHITIYRLENPNE